MSRRPISLMKEISSTLLDSRTAFLRTDSRCAAWRASARSWRRADSASRAATASSLATRTPRACAAASRSRADCSQRSRPRFRIAATCRSSARFRVSAGDGGLRWGELSFSWSVRLGDGCAVAERWSATAQASPSSSSSASAAASRFGDGGRKWLGFMAAPRPADQDAPEKQDRGDAPADGVAADRCSDSSVARDWRNSSRSSSASSCSTQVSASRQAISASRSRPAVASASLAAWCAAFSRHAAASARHRSASRRASRASSRAARSSRASVSFAAWASASARSRAATRSLDPSSASTFSLSGRSGRSLDGGTAGAPSPAAALWVDALDDDAPELLRRARFGLSSSSPPRTSNASTCDSAVTGGSGGARTSTTGNGAASALSFDVALACFLFFGDADFGLLRPGDRGGLRVGDVGSGVCAMRKEMRRLSSGVNEGFVGVVGGLLVVFVGGGSAVVGGAMPAVRTDELPVLRQISIGGRGRPRTGPGRRPRTRGRFGAGFGPYSLCGL